jgi:hypothetical protein
MQKKISFRHFGIMMPISEQKFAILRQVSNSVLRSRKEPHIWSELEPDPEP